MATDRERYERDMLKAMAKLSENWKTVDRLGHILDQVNDPDLEEILVSAMVRQLDILASSIIHAEATQDTRGIACGVYDRGDGRVGCGSVGRRSHIFLS